ncbi:MAG: hypothetical protein IKJ22_07040 [Paludibacteraceae bacterium]|nr:hypothetical protein [Paludibacteraceae bacterium]
MKKLFYLMSTLMLLLLASCEGTDPSNINTNDPNEYCWEITITASFLGYSDTETTYSWATGQELQEALITIEKSYEALEALGYDVDIKYKKTTHSIDECN